MRNLNEAEIKAINQLIQKLYLDYENKKNEHINSKSVIAYDLLLIFLQRREDCGSMEVAVLNGYVKMRYHFLKTPALLIYKESQWQNIVIEAIGIEIEKALPDLMAEINEALQYERLSLLFV